MKEKYADVRKNTGRPARKKTRGTEDRKRKRSVGNIAAGELEKNAARREKREGVKRTRSGATRAKNSREGTRDRNRGNRR